MAAFESLSFPITLAKLARPAVNDAAILSLWPGCSGHVTPKSATCSKKAAVPEEPEADAPHVARGLVPRLFPRRDQPGLNLGHFGDFGTLGRCQHPQHRVNGKNHA